MYVIQTRNVTKRFNDKEVISNVNMNVKQGQIYGLLGPEGCGKTTIIKLLMNLLQPTYGEILLFGETLTSRKYDLYKRIGSIIDVPAFYEHLSPKENLQLHGDYMGYHQKNAIQDVFELVGLKWNDKKPVNMLSLAMKQRLGIARAIMTKPDLVILDNHNIGLDAIGIKEMRTLIKRLSEQYGTTFLISSHALSEIQQIADVIGIMHQGKLKSEWSMEEVQQMRSDCIEMKTTNVKKAAFVLEEYLHISQFKVIDESMIRIYDTHFSEHALLKTLILNEIPIYHFTKKSGTLEDLFLKTVDRRE
ncbi:ATP-binding cassette domain-containing protein [Longirhabdus pacifica]|uniref:ATP-binding cassette domain-containing protein n=1 Tax=Longirhabdus pacifica TaxID=2305227 RepID=UPI001F0C64A3|nr:ATP-binding cassette domain-containing protein [Longirhabdus pacifica]